jgi:hypothetical protein
MKKTNKKKKEIKPAEPLQYEGPENIIRQHRRQAYLVEAKEVKGEGSLILTNHRLLFLNRIERSPEIEADIKRLADAPMKEVLDHGLSLNKENLEIPLYSIIKAGVGNYFSFPTPRFCLSVYYLHPRKLTPQTITFQFLNARSNILFGIFTQPQVMTAWSWGKSIRKAVSLSNKSTDSEKGKD